MIGEEYSKYLEEAKKRRLNIYLQKMGGKTYKQLSEELKVSIPRVLAIINHARREHPDLRKEELWKKDPVSQT